MPNIIQHKRSSTPGAVPLATGLSQGELGINIGDGKLYTKNSSNAIINLGVSSISGTYITPASGTFQTIQFNTNVEPDLLRGQIGWNDTEGTVNVALTDNTDIHIGQHNFYRVRNQTGSVLYKGQAVYATGVHSNGIITPSLYVANGSVREVRFIGLILENINNNNNGYAIQFGHVTEIDTRGNVASNIAVGNETWADGDILYVHPTVSGKLTNVEPKHSISTAIILDAASNGKIFVRPTSYGHLNDNHDVNVSGVTNGQFLQYNSSTDYWVPSSSGNFTSLSVNGTGVISSSGGTTNYISKFTGGSTIGNSLVFDNGTNVGIGTTTPTSQLHVIGTGLFSSALLVNNNIVWHSGNFDSSNIVRTTGTQTISGVKTFADGLKVVGNGAGVPIELGVSQDAIVLFGKTSNGLGIGSNSFNFSDSSTNVIDSRELLIGLNANDPILTISRGLLFAGNSGVGVINYYDNGAAVSANRLIFDVTPATTLASANTTLRTTTEDGNNIVVNLPNTSGTLALLTSINTSQITGTLPVNKGGTNITSYSNGQLLIGSGTSLVANTLSAGTGIAITNGSGTITINTSGLQTILTNPVTGTGTGASTSGYLPRWNSTSGLSNSIIYQSGNNIGIGTSTPSGQLHVIGSGIFSSGIIASNISVTDNMISATNTNGNLIIKPNASGALQADDAGNSRGIYSVDLQRSRVSVSGVAHGSYSVIGGGSNNNAMGPLCTIGGGSNNTAGGDYYPGNCSTIGGGENNIAVGEKSTVGGGSSNSAGGNYSIVGGGQSNSAGAPHSTVGGGIGNSAIANKSTISGGSYNSSSGEYSIVGGGRSNSAAGYISAVCGGNSNSASGSLSTVCGGDDNTAGADASTIAGGKTNTISAFANYSTIAGGQYNYTGSSYSSFYGLYAFVGGGYSNAIYSSYSTIGGGENNTIGSDTYSDSLFTKSVIGGGSNNTCDGVAATVGGGISNTASGYHCTVAGGFSNSASSYESTIGGGNSNSATATGSTVGGGRYNTASGNSDSVVCGGSNNLASGPGSTIAGGLSNTASGYASAVVGGIDALASSRGEISHATGKFADDGDAQHSIFVLRTKTTNNTATEMGLDGASVRLTINSGQILSGTINIIGSRSDGSAVARYLRQFTIKNVGGTTSLVGSIITLGTDEAAGTSISITADNTNDFLSIKVTGISSQTWRWVAVVDCIKTKYGT
jgi:hypothetical protein